MVTIVTGAASGLGAAAAKMLAATGGRVVINYRSREAAAQEVAAACEAAGGQAITVHGDVAKDEDCHGLVKATVEKWGRVDGLLNNAGTTKFAAADDLDALSAEDFQHIYAVNVVGPYQMIRAVAPQMKAQGSGSIVNIASTAGLNGFGSSTAYACSKGALITMGKSLARALGPEIRLNTVCPGFIQGEWLRDGLGAETYERLKAGIEQASPLKRAGTPEDMAEVAVWLLSAAGNVTGQEVVVDAGASLGPLRR
jgi:3-oxoacyl-[acyl-carrier protein] reductase